jgi:6-phosphofructokinase 2
MVAKIAGKQMSQIVSVTFNPALDKSCSVRQVVAEHKLRCGEPSHYPGGGGINVARAIHILGGKATAYWACGGAIGELFGSLLDSEGVAHCPVPIGAMTRENFIVFEESTERQFRFGMPGARLTESEIQVFLNRLQAIDPPPDFLILSGSLPPGVDQALYATTARVAARTCRVVLDTSGAALEQGIEAPLYLIKPNIRELGQLAGRQIENEAAIREVAKELIAKRKVEIVVTSLGSAGVTITTAEGHEHVHAPVVKIRSKVGAGDCTVAGIVLALSRGKSVPDAVRFGVAAGAAAVMTEGTELCRREDAERLYEQMLKF